ncbi:MAG TPA: winged-helix domain-containing protein [Urbifossiella sp.]|nr:winged-helix domain-containing protein [Urbifossiella sp.]
MATASMNHLHIAALCAAREHARLSDDPGPARALEVVGRVACMVQVWPASSQMPPGSLPLPVPDGALERCKAAILEAVHYHGAPVLRKQLLTLLREAGEHYGASTVAKALARLTAAGELVNRRGARGYRLPEWA